MTLPVLLAAITVGANSVTFTAKATGVGTRVPLEFVFAGPHSDRDYETLFLTEDSVEELRAAFAKAGAPEGRGYDPRRCIFWPVGAIVSTEPDFLSLFNTDTNSVHVTRRLVLTRGTSDREMPDAVFALYNCGQSLFQFDDSLDQSVVYGSFTAAKEWKKGERLSFKVSWGTEKSMDMTPDFPPDKTVAEARRVAEGLAKVDSREAKINGCREGQFYYQAFLPKALWRDRKERLVQPIELRLTPTNVLATVIHEDWSVEGDDPKLTPETFTLTPGKRALPEDKDTCFIFCTADTRLGRLYELKATLPANLRNFYIFTD